MCQRKVAELAIKVDVFISTAIGLTLFFAPQKVGNFLFNRTTDGIHWHLIRCIGGQLLVLAFIFHRLGRRSAETQTTCFLLRLASAILSIFLFRHAKSVGFMEPAIAGTAINIGYVAIFGCLLFLIRSGWPLGKDIHNSPIENIVYQIDSLVAVAIGVAWISHPKWLLHRQVSIELDCTHEFCGQIIGVFLICSQILALHALSWPSRADRLLAAEARAFTGMCILVAQIWSQLAYGTYWNGRHWVGISVFTTWTVLAICCRAVLGSLEPINNNKTKTVKVQ